MDLNYERIKSLYEQEINSYREQVEQLKGQVRQSDEINSCLNSKVRTLENLIEKAHVANKDLHAAFEHVRQENLKLQAVESAGDQQLVAVTDNSDENRALETIQQQYVNLAQESVSWLSTRDKMAQRIKFLERENERYHRDNVTLGKQVRHLLKTLEEERGMIIRRANQLSEDQQITSSLDVIDKHLVTFESIEQLQQQNQKLLSLVKDLSSQDEERTLQAENEDIKGLTTELAELKSHLESVKDDRERITNAFNTIMQERDLFKILLCKTRQAEHMTPEIFQRMVSIACASGPAIKAGPEDTPDKDARIIDLKGMISKLEQELLIIREEHESLRQKAADDIKLKNELLEQAHLKIVEESHRAEVLQERCTVLESNIKSLETEFDELRTRSQKLTFEVEQLNKTNSEEKKRHDSELEHLNRILSEEKQRFVSEVEQLTKTISDEKLRYISEIEQLHNTIEREKNRHSLEVQQLNKTITEEREHYNLEKERQLNLMTILSDMHERLKAIPTQAAPAPPPPVQATPAPPPPVQAAPVPPPPVQAAPVPPPPVQAAPAPTAQTEIAVSILKALRDQERAARLKLRSKYQRLLLRSKLAATFQVTKKQVYRKQVFPEQVYHKQVVPKQVISEQMYPKQIESMQVEPMQMELEQVEPKQVEPKQVEPKQLGPKQAELEPEQHIPRQKDPSQKDPEQPVPEQVDPMQLDQDHLDSEDLVPEQLVPEQPVQEQPVQEQPVQEQPVQEQPIQEQPVPEQPVPEQPVPEQPVPEQPVPEQLVPEQLDAKQLETIPNQAEIGRRPIILKRRNIL